jgi:transcriptional regulator with XRE-family HTH domain
MTSSGRAGRTAIKRPGAGIDIDRDRLIRMRQDRLMSRAQLAQAMSNGPCRSCGQPYSHKPMCPDEAEYTITPDAIAKIENGWRRPKTATLARMCAALGCEPADLLPGAVPQQASRKRAET